MSTTKSEPFAFLTIERNTDVEFLRERGVAQRDWSWFLYLDAEGEAVASGSADTREIAEAEGLAEAARDGLTPVDRTQLCEDRSSFGLVRAN